MNVNAVLPENREIIDDNRDLDRIAFAVGQKLEGIITAVDEKISIAFEDKEYKIPLSAVQNAKEGQIRIFEIKEVSNNSIVLKEVGDETPNSFKGVINTKISNGFSLYVDGKYQKKQVVDQNLISLVKKELRVIRNLISSEDYKLLKDEGTPLEEYKSSQLERAIKRIKEKRAFNVEHLSKQVEKKQEYREGFEKIVIANQAEASSKATLEETLKAAHLPLTKENIASLQLAYTYKEKIGSLSEGAIEHLIINKQKLTLENVYKANHSGGKTLSSRGKEIMSSNSYTITRNNSITSKELRALEENVKELLKSLNFDEQSSFNNAMWLLERNLEISPENLERKAVLDELKLSDNFNGINQLLLTGMKRGQLPLEVDLESELMHQHHVNGAKKIVDQVSILSEEDIASYINFEVAEAAGVIGSEESGESITLQQLIDAHYVNLNTLGANLDTFPANSTLRSKQGSNVIQTVGPSRTVSEKISNTRLQLEEIRAKLTYENAYRLYAMGINIASLRLDEAVDQLRNQQKELIVRKFNELGYTAETAEVASYLQTENAMSEIKGMPAIVLGATVQAANRISLGEFHQQSAEYIINRQIAVDAYEPLMTKPNKELGDSIKKAFIGLDNLLEEMNLEVSEANQRAVRILAYNQMEITEQNIRDIKFYDAKVSEMLHNMTPSTTVQMIKNNVNPLHMTIDSLNDYARTLQQNSDLMPEEKFSEYLYRLDQKKELSNEERQAYVGVYRLLHQIEKTDRAAVGSLINSKRELTLNHLLTGIRSQKVVGLDVQVDPQFGGVQLKGSNNSINVQIEGAFKNYKEVGDSNRANDGNLAHNDSSYQMQVLDNIKYLLRNTEVILELNGRITSENIQSMSLEQLYEELVVSEQNVISSENSQNNVELIYESDLLQQYLELAKMSEESINILSVLKDKPTVGELLSSGTLLANNYSFYQQLEDLFMKLSPLNEIDEDNKVVADKKGISQLHSIYHLFEEALGNEEKTNNLFNQIEQLINYQVEESIEHSVANRNLFEQAKIMRNAIRLAGKLSNSHIYEIPITLGEDVVNLRVQLKEKSSNQSGVQIDFTTKKIGLVKVSMLLNSDVVSGMILCDNREAVNVLKQSEGSIKEELSKLGLQVSQLAVILSNTRVVPDVQLDSYQEQNTVKTETLFEIAKVMVATVKQAEQQLGSM